MYFMVDATGTMMSVNPFGAEQLGYTAEELIGRPVQSLFHEADREAVQTNTAICLEQLGRALSWELRKIRKDGEALWVRETAGTMLIKKRPVVLIVCEDITERKRAAEALREVEMELAHANRVATMGQLSASIAHEVNQPIAAAITNAHAALRWLGTRPPDLEEVRQALGRIVQNGNRAGDVIGRIRALIKKAPPRKDVLAINEVIREVMELTRGEAVKNGVAVQTELADDLPRIEGDRVELQQVILNLVINAIEAMSGTSEGSRDLLISTGKAEPGGVLIAVRIRVRDWRQQLSSASSRPSTRPSRAVWGWACRSAGRSSKRTADDCGRARMCPAAPSFTLGCLSTRAAHRDWALGLSLPTYIANMPTEAARVCQGARPRWLRVSDAGPS